MSTTLIMQDKGIALGRFVIECGDTYYRLVWNGSAYELHAGGASSDKWSIHDPLASELDMSGPVAHLTYFLRKYMVYDQFVHMLDIPEVKFVKLTWDNFGFNVRDWDKAIEVELRPLS